MFFTLFAAFFVSNILFLVIGSWPIKEPRAGITRGALFLWAAVEVVSREMLRLVQRRRTLWRPTRVFFFILALYFSGHEGIRVGIRRVPPVPSRGSRARTALPSAIKNKATERIHKKGWNKKEKKGGRCATPRGLHFRRPSGVALGSSRAPPLSEPPLRIFLFLSRR